jgi:hypothetical protein
MSPIEFPKRAEELTPELLTAALAERRPGVVVEGLRVLEQAHCDSGSASTAARAVLDLDYAPGHDEGLPSRVVLKTVLIRPGAPGVMYENEVRFYRQLRPELDIETPQAYASIYDEASGSFGVVLEDLRLRSARFPDATGSMTQQEIMDALRHLARLHARFWSSPRFSRDLGWLWTPCSGGFHDFMRAGGFELIRDQIEGTPYKQELLVRLGRTLPELWELLWQAQAILASEPTTLLHGDAHLGNTYLLPGGRAGLLDWQLMNRGRWAHDVTYLLMTALETDFRRRHERELLAGYLEELRGGGVEDAPGLDDAWLLHRQTAIWGFLVGWCITPVENYGEEILRANLERLTAAVEDLETFDALSA